MRKPVAALASLAVMAGGIAHAAKDEAPELTRPMKLGDQAMNCDQILDEVAAMEERLGGDPSESFMDGAQMAGVGTNLAQRAALSAGAGGAAVGAIGQVGGLLGRSSKKKKEHEAAQRAIAEQRWLYMVGLYHGRSCGAQAPVTPEEATPAE